MLSANPLDRQGHNRAGLIMREKSVSMVYQDFLCGVPTLTTPLILLVRLAGIEPTTFSSGGRAKWGVVPCHILSQPVAPTR